MLQLPIGVRKLPPRNGGREATGSQEAMLPNAGRQLLSEALDERFHEQGSTLPPISQNRSVPSMKVVVKNTFIDIADADRERIEAHSGGIQTCTARTSSINPQLFPEASPSNDATSDTCSDETLPEDNVLSTVTVLPEGATLMSQFGASSLNRPQIPHADGKRTSPLNLSPVFSTNSQVSPTSQESGKSGVRVVVKNTVIEFVDEGETPDSSGSRNAQSCTARISGTGADALFPTEAEVEAASVERQSSSMFGNLMGYFSGRQSEPAVAAAETQSVETAEVNVGSGLTPVAESPHSASSSANPRSPPAAPEYPAPQVNGSQGALPPPPSHTAAASNAGRQVLLEALRDISRDDPDASEGLQLVVKNTFYDFDERRQVDDRGAQTCTARIGMTAAFPPTPKPVTGLEKPVAEKQAPPSMGSSVHGKLGEDGQPVCQPCAWFFKDSGCLNALNCRYCHLCPQGELKNRKKAKIARLREIEAAEAAAAAAAAAENGDATAAPAVSAAPAAQVGVQLQPTMAAVTVVSAQNRAPVLMVPAPMPMQPTLSMQRR